ncbi:rho GDP-dissociation inhibitor 1 [Plakobranchus ocellatus]|uniref:Rho GDP-dissociation inhibitor 1 n=1 Tax=Plakobranchus ocellatus TaxID=259542 RepID=A0AAV3Z3D0_9GAST|nr:rho GDP-dissociation inhibitor 1 [Plakobranchus ocellatus]
MAEQEQQQEQAAKEVEQSELEDEDNPNYKPPAPKALDEIVNQDAEDESLVKYKEALLGTAAKNVVIGTDILYTLPRAKGTPL